MDSDWIALGVAVVVFSAMLYAGEWLYCEVVRWWNRRKRERMEW